MSTINRNLQKSKIKTAEIRKALVKSVEVGLARTHKSFGLFPSALLLMGYGESKLESERVVKTEERDVKTGETVTRQLKMFSKSEKGLPRGKDPQVLIALLHLILRKQNVSNSVWFRKSDLFDVLGWQDTYENRQNVIEAIERYFDSAYEGLLLKNNNKKERRDRKTSRIITDFRYIDERSIRSLNASIDNASDMDADYEFNFSKVVFNTEFINEIRTADLSLHLNLRIIHKVQNSPIAVRLYEIINYLTTPKSLDFSIEIADLAYNRLGMSASKNAGQCWQKIAPAGEKLKKAEYLLSFDYDRATKIISGLVNPKLVSPSTTNLEPLQKTDERRLALVEQYMELGAYKNLATQLINDLNEDQLEDAEIIAQVISHEINKKSFGPNFKYGGRAINHLKFLLENGEIDQKLFNHVSSIEELFKDGSPGANRQIESAAFNDQHEEDSFLKSLKKKNPGVFAATASIETEEEQENVSFEAPPSPLSSSTSGLLDHQFSLPISFDDIQVVDKKAEELWNNCLTLLSKSLPETVFETWFDETILTAESCRDQQLVLQVRDQISLDWIHQNYQKKLQNALDSATKTKNKWRINLKT